MPTTNLRLEEKYKKEVIPILKKAFGIKNDLAVPRIIKVVVNVGIGKYLNNLSANADKEKTLEQLKKAVSLITGQWPMETRAKKSISGFKARKGAVVGLKVTLRRKRMYDFLERLIKIVLPRVRDFRGLPLKNFDQNGNLNIGLKELAVFPEVALLDIARQIGAEITVVPYAKNQKEAIELFKQLGFPIKFQ